MKQYILTTSFLFALFVFANGQSIEDALRFSQHTEGGTARSVAMGGAFGALGGDFSTLSSNPAGLGIYRKSEFTFTPEFYLSSTVTRYNLNEESDNKFNFNVSNLGYVAVFDKSGGAIKSVNFGIGFNRIANFHRNTTVVGENRNNSYGDYMAIEAYELGLETPNVDNFAYFSSDLFYQSYVIDYYYDADNGIDTFELGGWYFADDEHTPSGFLYPKQTVLTTERGRINEWAISLGINIGDMLYIGGTLGVQPVYYKQERNFIEEDDAGDLSYRYFNYNTETTVRGTGYTAKFGAIFRPVQPLRIGMAVHLPVTYMLNQEFESYITTQEGTFYPADNYGRLDELEAKYTVISPFKAMGSVALVLGKMVIISGDLEYVDYSSMTMKGEYLDFTYDNQDIEQFYKEALNIRVGGELRLGSVYFRGGLGYYSSPYADNEVNADADRMSVSGGFGMRDGNTFFDLALQHTLTESVSYLYWDNSVNNECRATRLMATIGFKF